MDPTDADTAARALLWAPIVHTVQAERRMTLQERDQARLDELHEPCWLPLITVVPTHTARALAAPGELRSIYWEQNLQHPAGEVRLRTDSPPTVVAFTSAVRDALMAERLALVEDAPPPVDDRAQHFGWFTAAAPGRMPVDVDRLTDEGVLVFHEVHTLHPGGRVAIASHGGPLLCARTAALTTAVADGLLREVPPQPWRATLP